MNEVLQVGFTGHQEFLADSGKHLGTGRCGVGLGDFKGKFLAF
jgi:hypothetical protein